MIHEITARIAWAKRDSKGWGGCTSMACGIEEGIPLCISIASGVDVFQEAWCLGQGEEGGYTMLLRAL